MAHIRKTIERLIRFSVVFSHNQAVYLYKAEEFQPDYRMSCLLSSSTSLYILDIHKE